MLELLIQPDSSIRPRILTGDLHVTIPRPETQTRFGSRVFLDDSGSQAGIWASNTLRMYDVRINEAAATYELANYITTLPSDNTRNATANHDMSEVVSAFTYGSQGYLNSWTRDGNVWTKQTNVTTNDATNFFFGEEVAFSADNKQMLVSQTRGFGGNGRVAQYTKSGSTWNFDTWITPVSNGGIFGTSIAISRDMTTLAIGAPNSDGAQGSVHLYVKSAGDWVRSAILKRASPAQSDYLGYKVVISDDGNTVFSSTRNGKGITVFRRVNGVWSHATTIAPPTAGYIDMTGSSMACSGDARGLVFTASNGGSASQVCYVYQDNEQVNAWGNRWVKGLSGYNTQSQVLQMNRLGTRLMVGDWNFESTTGQVLIYK